MRRAAFPVVCLLLVAASGAAAAAQPADDVRALADEMLDTRPSLPNFLPMPQSRPMQLPQQEAPGVVVGRAITESESESEGEGESQSQSETEAAGDAPEALVAATQRAVEDGEEELIAIPTALLHPDEEPSEAPLRLSHYAFGAYQRGLYSTAFKVALRASAQDDPAAAALIGRLYEEALGVEQDLAKAAGWYAVAADLGNAAAENRLASMLLLGRGVPKDPVKAGEVFERAAEHGSGDAAHALALLYLKGEGREQNVDAAFRYMKLAAERGEPKAQYALAIMYEEGQGTLPDDVEATRWYGRAAESGDPAASLAYAERKLFGIGAEPNAQVALPFLALAARSGNARAMNMMARALADGHGGDADEVEAIKWHLLARRAGISDLYLDGFMGTRDPAVVAEAQERVAQFIPRYVRR